AAAFGGWQRASLGAAGTGWTGFDYLHGGQSIINTFVLDKEAVANEQFDFDVALVIQYTDPRGAGGKVDRLPPTVIDVQQFAYRLPYAALDCSQIVVTASPVPLKPQNGDTEPYTVKVRDWDAGATEAADSKVGDESDVSLVQLGAAGHPMLELDAPGVLNSIVTLPDAASGTGISDAPLTYNATLTNQTNAPAGEYWGLLQVTDPEDGDAARGTYHTGIDPDTILPDSTRTIGARTYQVVPITVGPAVPSVIAVTPSGVVGAMGHSITFSAQVSGTVTTYAWNFGSDATPPTSTVAAPLIALPDEPGSYNGTLTLTNAGGTGPAFPFSYEVGFPTPPHWAEHQITTHIWGFHQQPNAVPAAVINGVPAAVFQPNDELDNLTDVAYVRALTANPQSVADWSITMVGRIGHDPTLAEIAGRPVIAMADDVTGDLSYGTTPQANPTGPADWNFHVMAGGGSTPSITEHEGRPAVAYRVGATVLWYARASSAVPTSTGDWNKHSVLLTSQAGPQIAVMQSEAGPRLVIGATFNMKGVIAGAKPLEPLSSSDWVTNYFDNDDPNSYAIALTTLPNPDGTDALVVAWEDANNSGITRRGTWFAPTPGMIIFDAPMFLGQCAQQLRLGLTTSHGRPFMVIPKPNELGVQMFRGLSSHPLAFDWQSQDPFSIQTDTIDNIVPLDLGDHLGVFYLDLGSGAGAELHYAAADSPW
ncbi:MAG: PKD domain-containing protein, partial [bacterium]